MTNKRKIMDTISEEVFLDIYQPIDNHIDDNASFDGKLFETYDEELDYAFKKSKEGNHVWTVIEEEYGWVVEAGFRYVNRIGFVITKKPWVTGNEYVELID